jgi:hypothetical protein
VFVGGDDGELKRSSIEGKRQRMGFRDLGEETADGREDPGAVVFPSRADRHPHDHYHSRDVLRIEAETKRLLRRGRPPLLCRICLRLLVAADHRSPCFLQLTLPSYGAVATRPPWWEKTLLATNKRGDGHSDVARGRFCCSIVVFGSCCRALPRRTLPL